MKKHILYMLAGLMALLPVLAFAAAGTTTATCANILGGETKTITYSWTGDTSSGAVTSLASGSITCPGATTGTTFVQGYYLCGMETSTTVAKRPTDDYDVYVYDALSNDLLGGAGANRDSNSTEYVAPTLLSTTITGMGCRYVTGAYTLTITGQSAASAAGSVTLFFSKP